MRYEWCLNLFVFIVTSVLFKACGTFKQQKQIQSALDTYTFTSQVSQKQLQNK